MSSRGFASMLRILVEAVERAFWTALLAAAVTAVCGFPTFFILGNAPIAGYDGMFMFLACLVGFPWFAVISGVVWGVITPIWHPRRLRPWLIAGAVGIGLSLLLAVVALISGSEAACYLAGLCWFPLSLVVLPAASAARVHAWLQGRGRRGVRYSRAAAAFLVVVVLAAVVGTVLRFPWLIPWR